MKFITYISILFALSGCSTIKAADYEYPYQEQIVVDTTLPSAIKFLQKMGYENPLITGNRTEDCLDDHYVFGYGVILKVFEKTGPPTAASGVLCIDIDGNYTINFDMVK